MYFVLASYITSHHTKIAAGDKAWGFEVSSCDVIKLRCCSFLVNLFKNQDFMIMIIIIINVDRSFLVFSLFFISIVIKSSYELAL